jgi:esterase/lipase
LTSSNTFNVQNFFDELKKNKNRLALVKNAELNKITIPPNTVMEIQGCCDKETQYRNTSAIHHASDSSDKSLLLISTLSRNDVSTG